jgi:murein DD-endopeptidase MepM/ murein hydrolase activator NlpD
MMHEFDPRRPVYRIAPRALMVVAGCFVLLLGVRLQTAEASLPTAGLKAIDAARIIALQDRAFAESEVQPGFIQAEMVEVEVQPGETFLGAVRRTGVDPDQAYETVSLLSEAYDTVNIRAGLRFSAAVAQPASAGASPGLVGLTMRTGPATQIAISRAYDGTLRLREMTEQIEEETVVVQGDINGSLYMSASEMGATSAMISQTAKLFSHKIDFDRDIRAGDSFKMVFTRHVTEGGRTVEGLNLLYAEITSARAGGEPIRFYRFDNGDGSQPEYFDEEGQSTRGFLMRTPIGFTRVTSSYGSRKHPVLGYTRMHTGIDFGGATGTPIYAAGDGVIARAGPNGGYGNWVQIRHGRGWETGYAHMSRIASGIRAGVSVKQGQLIGYVGATGTATGPHLHYEVIKNGQKINPRSADIPAGGRELAGTELATFMAERTGMDTMIASATTPGLTQLARSEAIPAQTTVIEAPATQQVALRR